MEVAVDPLVNRRSARLDGSSFRTVRGGRVITAALAGLTSAVTTLGVTAAPFQSVRNL